MRAIYPGHRYELDHLDGNGKSVLQFVQRLPLHVPMEGVTNQEVLRAVIDRVKSLDAEIPWAGNAQIIRHLRMAILLHESRAMERYIEKHEFAVEAVELGEDGHFKLQNMRAAA
ncbi:MAG: hypothetical protein E5Y73_11165 [Mesorhizobium sp.]|uniref:hypothetical protein n=1 Tax=Mesorhizobium sp. TaxID=1871066 RepID=UPI00121B1A3B|nr:hypothetical protein [Mesorhizobium sp.]TIL94661.1 MAG: hypothetical protein E5Y73_11165 [Mesorhizobium sp.]